MTTPAPRGTAAKRILAGTAAVAIALLGMVGVAAPAYGVSSEVTNLNDAGAGSLRDAIALANADPAVDTITFTPGLTGTIPLATKLGITESLIIDGTGADITVSRVDGVSFDLIEANFVGYKFLTLVGFSVSNDGGATADLGRGLVVFDGGGGPVGNVTLTDMTFFGHDGANPSGGGGAISLYEATTVTITGGSISSNEVDPGYSGGGLYFIGDNAGSLTIDGTTFASNQAGSGGAFYVESVNKVTITGATFQLNNANGTFPSGYGGAGEIQDVAADGVVIEEGTLFDENTADEGDGGALFLSEVDGPLVITDSTFQNNEATNRYGGAILSSQTGPVTITDSTFSTNTAGTGGGGAYLDFVGGAVTLSGATFADNEAQDGEAGGLFIGSLSGGIAIGASSFRDNQAYGSGGGAYIFDIPAASTISDSQFLSNSTVIGSGAGLQITDVNAPLTVSRTTFRENDAEDGGVALDVTAIDAAAELTIDSSTFAANTPAPGGTQRASALAVGTAAGAVTILNSTISEAGPLAAIYFDTNPSTSDFTVEHSTIVSAATAIFIRDMSTSDFGIANSIIVGTGADGAIDVDASQGGEVEVEWSILSTGVTGSVIDVTGNQLSTNPLLAALADNGGPTQTRTLLPASPARDMGDPAFVAPPSVDQRGTGFARVVNGRLDIGAVEVAAVLPATGQTVSWWLLPVAGGVLMIGVIALVIVRRRPTGRRRA